ncbi:MAG: LPS export ABC transporter periplasmic protein LptC [Porticoccaceae bacterium]|nr:LPS export ABC transporter periplasmic protein LptC [Porticoccaceae bacterium]
MINQFLLMACLIVVTGSFLLLWDSPPESFLRPENSKVEQLPIADSYMRNIKAFIFAADGAKKYSLEASEMSFFSGLSELKLSQPVFMTHSANNQNGEFKVRANNGTVFKKTQIFEFNGDVNANWENVGGKIDLNAGSLSYSLKEDSASAEGGVELITPNTKMTGDSLSADFYNELLKIESRVRGTHESI